MLNLKLEQLYNTSYLKDEVSGNDSSIFDVGNYANASFVDAIKGKGLQIEDGDNVGCSFNPTTVGLDKDAGSITFDFNPPSSFSSRTKYLFRFASNFFCTINTSDQLSYRYGNVMDTGSNLTINIGQNSRITFIWYNDTTNQHVWILINGKIVSKESDTTTSISLLSACCLFNYTKTDTDPAMATYDNLKIYDTPILPYGTKIFGDVIYNDEYTRAHDDITLYSNTTSLDIGTTSVTDISNISNAEGSIAFQVDPPSALSANETLFSAGTSFKIEWINADNDIKFTYGTVTIQTTASLPAGLDGKHWIDCRYKASGDILLIVNGIKYSASASTAPTLGAAIAWSSNVGMTRRTITNSQSTPELWTANLTPLNGPSFKSEVA